MRTRTLGTGLLAAALVAAGALLMSTLAGDRGVAGAEPGGGGRSAAARADPWVTPAHRLRPALLYERFESFGRADGLPTDRTTCVLAEGDLLAVGTEDGLAVRRGAAAWAVKSEKDGLAHRYVTSVSRDAATGDLWIGTLRGLSRLSGGALRTWRQTDSGLLNDVVYQVRCDGPLVWAATAAGLSCLDTRTGTWADFDVKNSIMHEPWCYSVTVARGFAWVGVWGGGVVELDRGSGNWKEYRDPDGEMEIDLLPDDGPIHEVTSSVAYDDGVLWQGTYFGLSRYDGRRWTSYTAADTGIPGDFISHVDSRGATVWLSTDQGLGVFDGETCVSYRRTPEGRCDVSVRRGGAEVERRTLETAPADNYVLWAQGGDRDVWIATGRGLSHGIAADAGDRKER